MAFISWPPATHSPPPTYAAGGNSVSERASIRVTPPPPFHRYYHHHRYYYYYYYHRYYTSTTSTSRLVSRVVSLSLCPSKPRVRFAPLTLAAASLPSLSPGTRRARNQPIVPLILSLSLFSSSSAFVPLLPLPAAGPRARDSAHFRISYL